MNVDEALKILGGMVYKPEWTFFWAASGEYDGMIHLVVIVNAPNSNDTPKYEEQARNTTNHVIDVSNCKRPSDVYALVMHIIALLERHEMLEFLGFANEDGKSWEKPYHPHTVHGRRNLERLPAVKYNADAQAYGL